MAKHTQDDTPAHATRLPEADVDRLLEEETESADDAGLDEATQLRKREERNEPESLEEENIGLHHVSGIDEEEVGKELNLSGGEDADEDEYGNTVRPDGATPL